MSDEQQLRHEPVFLIFQSLLKMITDGNGHFLRNITQGLVAKAAHDILQGVRQDADVADIT